MSGRSAVLSTDVRLYVFRTLPLRLELSSTSLSLQQVSRGGGRWPMWCPKKVLQRTILLQLAGPGERPFAVKKHLTKWYNKTDKVCHNHKEDNSLRKNNAMMEVKWAGRRRGALIPQSVGMRLGRVRLCACTLGVFIILFIHITNTWNSMSAFSWPHVCEVG